MPHCQERYYDRIIEEGFSCPDVAKYIPESKLL